VCARELKDKFLCHDSEMLLELSLGN